MTSTLEKIASQAGVSPRTVQRMLSGRAAEFRPSTIRRAERIKALARKLNHKPNAAAKATRTGRTNTIAILRGVGTTISSLPRRFEDSVLDSARDCDLHVVLARVTDAKLDDLDYLPRVLREWFVEGLLMVYTHAVPPRLHVLLEEAKVPAIWFNAKQPVDCVHPDDHDAARRLTDHFIEKGHRDIAYVDYSHRHDQPRTHHYSAFDRLAGYQAAMKRAGLPPRFIGDRNAISGRGTRQERQDFSRSWLESPQRPQAVICYGQTEVYPVILSALGMGLSLPDDLAVASFEDQLIDTCGQVLPTMVQDHWLAGQKAIELLTQKIQQPRVEIPPVKIPYRFEVGDPQ